MILNADQLWDIYTKAQLIAEPHHNGKVFATNLTQSVIETYISETASTPASEVQDRITLLLMSLRAAHDLAVATNAPERFVQAFADHISNKATYEQLNSLLPILDHELPHTYERLGFLVIYDNGTCCDYFGDEHRAKLQVDLLTKLGKIDIELTPIQRAAISPK